MKSKARGGGGLFCSCIVMEVPDTMNNQFMVSGTLFLANSDV